MLTRMILEFLDPVDAPGTSCPASRAEHPSPTNSLPASRIHATLNAFALNAEVDVVSTP